MRGSSFVQGRFRPQNPQKYRGDVNQIIYRSSWELVLFRFLDDTDAVVGWNSEETVIPYISSVDGKKHRYFLDATVWIRQPDGSVKKKLVEVKPYEEVEKPVKRGREKDQAFAERARTWMVNQSKWHAAREYAKAHDSEFLVITERELFPQNHSLKRYRQPPKKKT